MSSYTKISDKLYKAEIEGELRDISVPFAKAELIFSAVVESGCIISEDMELNPYALVKNFGKLASILLNEYDDTGTLIKAGNCNLMDTKDVLTLVKVGIDSFKGFTEALSALNTEDKASDGKEKVKKAKKE